MHEAMLPDRIEMFSEFYQQTKREHKHAVK